MAEVMSDVTAVVLCGGRGSRMGSLTLDLPKPLLPVRGRPILHYILGMLRQRGIGRVVLPIGYKGEEIVRFVEQADFGDDFDVRLVETGENTSIADRLRGVRAHLPTSGEMLLTNGDTVFDFPIDEAVATHRAADRKVTLCTVSIRSQFGLVLAQDGAVIGFERNSPVSHFAVSGRDEQIGLINAGIAVIDLADIHAWLDDRHDERSDNFEELYYGVRCAAGEAGAYRVPGFWKNFDTAKDIEEADRPDIASVLDRLARD